MDQIITLQIFIILYFRLIFFGLMKYYNLLFTSRLILNLKKVKLGCPWIQSSLSNNMDIDSKKSFKTLTY